MLRAMVEPCVPTPDGVAARAQIKRACVRIRTSVLVLLGLLAAALAGLMLWFSSDAYADGGRYVNRQYGFSLQFPASWENQYTIQETADRIFIRHRVLAAKYGGSCGTLVELRLCEGETLPAPPFQSLGAVGEFQLLWALPPLECPENEPELLAACQTLLADWPLVLEHTDYLRVFQPQVDVAVAEGFPASRLERLSTLAGTGSVEKIAAQLPLSHLLERAWLEEGIPHLSYQAEALEEYHAMYLTDLLRHMAAACFVLLPETDELVVELNDCSLGYTRASCQAVYGVADLPALAGDTAAWLACILSDPVPGRSRAVGTVGRSAAVKEPTVIRNAPWSGAEAVLALEPGQLVLVEEEAGDYARVAWTFAPFPCPEGYLPRQALKSDSAALRAGRDAYALSASVYDAPGGGLLQTDFRGVLSVRERLAGWLYCALPDGGAGWLDANQVCFAAPEEDISLPNWKLAQACALALADAFRQDVNLNLGAERILVDTGLLDSFGAELQADILSEVTRASGLPAQAGEREALSMDDRVLFLTMEEADNSVTAQAALLKTKKYRTAWKYIAVECLLQWAGDGWTLGRSVITEAT